MVRAMEKPEASSRNLSPGLLTRILECRSALVARIDPSPSEPIGP